MKKNAIWLIVGIVILLLGLYQNTVYESGIKVRAVITEIKTVEEDTDDSSISYRHTYYGEYTVKGKKYENKKLTTTHTSSDIPEHSVGDSIIIVVDANSPERLVSEGGMFGTVGLVMIAYNSVVLYKRRKREETE